jgi:hypothetical protein
MKKASILASLIFCFFWGCQNKKQIDYNSNTSKNKFSFLSSIDSHFNEIDLTKGVDSTVEIYRIWRLCAFQDDTSNLIIIENKSNGITLLEKKFIYKHSIPISTDSVFCIKKKRLNEENWRLFKDKIYNSYYWDLSNASDDGNIIDCNTYIFEGARNNNRVSKKYNMFVAQCPQGSMQEMYSYLKSLD